ncbi:hypothetical protein [Pseudoxanthomonas sp. Root630]|uniref:hypothetical protein n=1 Tax=Pseudoxanthomonas sp. Root630 TaxID=1736574 RepID=UPI0012DBCC9A|nr:hypothetical protein [Pseudoxanthomonas sp. Root630]
MNRLVVSQSRCFRLLVVLASAALLWACKPPGSGVEVELITGKEFAIAVSNRSPDVLVVDDRLFGLGIESSVKVEVAQADGTIIPPCGYLDYVGTGSRVSVPPGEKMVLSVQLTALTATRCLAPNEQYLFRALLVSGDVDVARTDWVSFRAASLE